MEGIAVMGPVVEGKELEGDEISDGTNTFLQDETWVTMMMLMMTMTRTLTTICKDKTT
jgi:hypothetical protein